MPISILLSGDSFFPNGFVPAVVCYGQFEQVTFPFRGTAVVERMGDRSIHRIAVEQDPFPVDCGGVTPQSGVVVAPFEGDAAGLDRFVRIELRGDLRGNRIDYDAELS